MKKQNIIIFSIFLLIVLGFTLISCKDTNTEVEQEVIEEETRAKYFDITLSGELERTGTYNVPSHWTVEMLFDFAGVKDGGDISGYDLTILIEDGMVYHVPKLEHQKQSKNHKININIATKEELMSVTGIGNVIANNIINYRKNTPFTKVEDVKNVSGIGNSVYEKIKNFITV